MIVPQNIYPNTYNTNNTKKRDGDKKMNQKELLEAIESTTTPKMAHICDLGRVEVANIERREVKEDTFQTNDNGKVTEQKKTRIMLKLKNRDDLVIMPISAWGQLGKMIKELPQMTAFKVIKSGEKKDTKYQVIPFSV